MRIHLFVIENNVTGSGGGYDQSNYYSSQSSAAGGTTHPLYNEDNPIVGYNNRGFVLYSVSLITRGFFLRGDTS